MRLRLSGALVGVLLAGPALAQALPTYPTITTPAAGDLVQVGINHYTYGTYISAANLATWILAQGGGITGYTPNLPFIGSAGGGLAQGTRSGNTTAFATANGTLTNGHCVSIDASGNFVDAGGACTTGGGGGTVSSGTAGQFAYYAGSGTTVSGTTVDATERTALAIATNTTGGLVTYPVANTSVPSGAVMAFNLAACPTGWVASDGTGGTVDMRGLVARGYDPTKVNDPAGPARNSLESDQVKTITVTAPTSGNFFGDSTTGGVSNVTGWVYSSSPYHAYLFTNATVSGPTFGAETRVKSRILLYCQKS